MSEPTTCHASREHGTGDKSSRSGGELVCAEVGNGRVGMYLSGDTSSNDGN